MKYLTILLSVTISFLFLEFFVRFFIDDGMNYEIEMMKYANKLKIISSSPNIGIEHKKNFKAKLMGADMILDIDGFRNNKVKRENKKKIIMLGDSMTLGWGTKRPFSQILNDKILNYEVINAGIGNTNSIMQISNFLENYSTKYEYEIVILNFFINDFEDVKIKKPNFLQKYSFFYTYLNNKINTILIKFNFKKNWQNFYSDNYLNKDMQKKTLLQLTELKKFCDENNIKLIIHNIPELRDLNSYKFNRETDIIKKFSENNDIDFVDSIEVLNKYEGEELWVTKEDPHANDKAHKIIADFLIKEISKNIN